MIKELRDLRHSVPEWGDTWNVISNYSYELTSPPGWWSYAPETYTTFADSFYWVTLRRYGSPQKSPYSLIIQARPAESANCATHHHTLYGVYGLRPGSSAWEYIGGGAMHYGVVEGEQECRMTTQLTHPTLKALVAGTDAVHVPAHIYSRIAIAAAVNSHWGAGCGHHGCYHPVTVKITSRLATEAVKNDLGVLNTDGTSKLLVTGGTGRFIPTGEVPAPSMGSWLQTPGITPGFADFNGDGMTDVAATGPWGWRTVPVMLGSQEDAYWQVQNLGSEFAIVAPGAPTRIVGDFFGNGGAGFAAVGGAGWNSIPIAQPSGSGGPFEYRNHYVGEFGAWANFAKHRLGGDFNGDGRTDVALLNPGWGSIPVASCWGSWFSVDNIIDDASFVNFNQWSDYYGRTRPIVADFTGDGMSEIALINPYWASAPTAVSQGTGRFRVVNTVSDGMREFSVLAASPGVRDVVGDFNGDGLQDIALVGIAGRSSVPVACANGYGGWTRADLAFTGPLQDTWNDGRVKAFPLDYNSDGYTDLAFTGHPSWTQGIHVLTNRFGKRMQSSQTPSYTADFGIRAAKPGATVFAGTLILWTTQ